MIHLFLFIIAWPAWGWAEEPVKIGGPGCLMWVERTGEVKIEMKDCLSSMTRKFKVVDNSYSTLLTCNQESTQCWTPCELRMREAMRSANVYLKGPWNTAWNESAKWDQAMKDCVEGK